MYLHDYISNKPRVSDFTEPSTNNGGVGPYVQGAGTNHRARGGSGMNGMY